MKMERVLGLEISDNEIGLSFLAESQAPDTPALSWDLLMLSVIVFLLELLVLTHHVLPIAFQ